LPLSNVNRVLFQCPCSTTTLPVVFQHIAFPSWPLHLVLPSFSLFPSPFLLDCVIGPYFQVHKPFHSLASLTSSLPAVSGKHTICHPLPFLNPCCSSCNSYSTLPNPPSRILSSSITCGVTKKCAVSVFPWVFHNSILVPY